MRCALFGCSTVEETRGASWVVLVALLTEKTVKVPVVLVGLDRSNPSLSRTPHTFNNASSQCPSAASRRVYRRWLSSVCHLVTPMGPRRGVLPGLGHHDQARTSTQGRIPEDNVLLPASSKRWPRILLGRYMLHRQVQQRRALGGDKLHVPLLQAG